MAAAECAGSAPNSSHNCQGFHGTASAAVAVTRSPAAATLTPSQTGAFAATVSATSKAAATWALTRIGHRRASDLRSARRGAGAVSDTWE